MKKNDNIALIEELASSQGGVFTSAQADAFGVPRYALSYAAKAGRIERLFQGAYRLAASPDDGYAELAALWMLTKPAAFPHERMHSFDGVAACGETAAAVLEIGDYHLTPYQIAVPKRFNSRIRDARFAVSKVDAADVTWTHGFPVTRPERTVADLVGMGGDPSLAADAFVDAVDRYGTGSFDIRRLEALLGSARFEELLADAGVGDWLELVETDPLGHVALKRK